MREGGEKLVVSGLVLRTTDTKESDKILTVLTAPFGRISVIAKGARSRRSKYAAACEMLVYSEMTLTRKGEWYYLNEAATIEQFVPLRAKLEDLALASYFVELTEAVCREQLEAQELLPLLLNALYALSALQKPPRLVKAAFTWRLLAEAGFAPLAEGCAVCGAEPPIQPVLSVTEGVVCCRDCAADGTLRLPLGGGALDALRHILACPSKRLYSFSVSPQALTMLDGAAEAFCAAQLERGFRTLDYYKAVAPHEVEV